ncbi:DUF2938 domain-containing protein [Novosphingobium sp. 1949]|uniref:DUF2938 domain-containing protein n=1 Tax=Novosphingobium organovorum TaxID=2930092 RepID=A0ABT0BBS4_9SPHN|nr:DUF2938 family protein [Novosphingobium organovorum]MCJ2182515.1 DUF2938 domain-containing protein [Novosphingobium organovorum]
MLHDVLLFTVLVGLGSTIALDIWVTLLEKVIGFPATNWGMVGRWLAGLGRGQLVLDGANASSPSGAEKALGWAFHYGIGFAYALLIPLVFGPGVIAQPSVPPFVVIGLIASTVAGLVILFPGMGGGFFASRLPNQGVTILYLIVAHGVFAAAEYGTARLVPALL